MDRTVKVGMQRILATIRASIRNCGGVSFNEGILDFLALGCTPRCKAAPLTKT
jgi:hypothetical protein